jgi:hypothetical protein
MTSSAGGLGKGECQQEHVNGSIIDADATLFELGTRLQYFSQLKDKKLSQKGKKMRPHHSKRNGGQEGNGEEGKRAGGYGYRQNENTILYNTEHTHTHTHFFSEYRLLWISLYVLLILSLYVCIYTYKAIHHTHTDTHTFSVHVCLSFVCVCDRERGGVPSLERGMCSTLWVGGRERVRRV